MDMSILAQAAEAATENPEAIAGVTDIGLKVLGGAIGMGFSVIGGGIGIGIVGGKTVESIARQPEIGNSIFTKFFVISALIEGITFLALVLCLLLMIK